MPGALQFLSVGPGARQMCPGLCRRLCGWRVASGRWRGRVRGLRQGTSAPRGGAGMGGWGDGGVQESSAGAGPQLLLRALPGACSPRHQRDQLLKRLLGARQICFQPWLRPSEVHKGHAGLLPNSPPQPCLLFSRFA